MHTFARIIPSFRYIHVFKLILCLMITGFIGVVGWRHLPVVYGRFNGAQPELPGKTTSAAIANHFQKHPQSVSNLAIQIKKLAITDGMVGDEFGVATAASGDTLVVGAHQHDVDGKSNQGIAYVFERNQGGPDNWGLVKLLAASDPAAENYFGAEVVIDGDTIVVTAYGNNSFKGAAYIFERNQGGSNNWGEVKKLVASDGVEGDTFGHSAAISGDTVIIAATLDDNERGSAYIFERNQGGGNNWGEVKKLVPNDIGSPDAFGRWMAISNNTLLVSAPQQANNRGAAYVFERDQGGTDNWGLVKKLLPSDGAAGDLFGRGVAVRGDIIVVGAPVHNARQGAAYVFKRNQGGVNNWGQTQQLTGSDATSGDVYGNFGERGIAISNSQIIVGAYQNESYQGAAYVYELNQSGVWDQIQKLTSSDIAPGDQFGYTLAISGNKLFVGSFRKNSQQGAAYLFSIGSTCSSLPSGLVSWWRAEGNANDSVGGNHGAVEGSVTFAPGIVGQAFKFNGNQNDGINLGNVPAFDFSPDSSFTLEAWINPSTLTPQDQSIFGLNYKCSLTTEGIGLTFNALSFGVRDANGNGQSSAPTFLIPTANTWYHVIGTREVTGSGRTVRLYVNGVLIDTVTDNTTGVLANDGPDYIGRRYPCNDTTPFNGLIDEVAVYNRALTQSEVLALYNAGSAGKCVCTPPVLTTQPANQVVSAGGTAVFIAAANGDPMPSVRWQVSTDGGATFNDIPGQNSATLHTATLTLANVSYAKNGNKYRAVFTNTCGGVNSEAATLTVTCPTITVEPPTLAAGRMGEVYLQVFTHSGSAGAASFSLTAGSLPAGLTLSAAGVLSGTPTVIGSFNFRVRATDANGCLGERDYGLQINPPCGVITISPVTLPGGLVGVAYNQMLTATEATGALNWVVSAGMLPPGLSLSPSGILSGTPTAAGTFSFTVKVTDANGCAGTQTYALVISTCPAIAIVPASLSSITTFTFYSQQLTASGGASPYSFTVSAGVLPAGLTLTPGGLLSGVPTAAGTFNFTVRAIDANTCFGERPYALMITANSGLMFYPLPAPVRLLETRSAPDFTGCERPNAPIAHGATLTVPTRTVCAGIPANAAAITGNVTVVPAEAGYLTIFPNAPLPQVANSNFKVAEVTNNVFTVGLAPADGTFKIFASAMTEVVVDVTGYYAPPTVTGLYFHPLPSPVRLLDSRPGFGGCFAPSMKLIGTGGPNADPALDLALQGRSPIPSPCNSISAMAQVLVGNATSVLPTGGGYLTIYPDAETRPAVASSNYAGSDVINGPFAVKLGADGKFKVYTFATTDLVIDILGYYSAEANDASGPGLLFNPLPKPMRLLETRNIPGFTLTGCYQPKAPIPGGTGGIRTQQAWGSCADQPPLAIPNTARALAGNATVLNPVNAGFATFFPGDVLTAPMVATTNYPFPVTFGYNRHYYVGLNPSDGTFKMLTQFTTDLIVDVSGFFAP